MSAELPSEEYVPKIIDPALLDSAPLEAEIYSRKFNRFVKAAWPLVEPNRDFIDNWHIDAICDHLEAVTLGEIGQLVISIPPRHMKSLLVAVFWQPWSWTRMPWTRWMFASYSEKIAIRDNVRARRVVQSEWYRERWGDKFVLTGDQNAKQRFENDKTGMRFATSVGGTATGEGGDYLICDDPHSADEADSNAKREAALSWWRNVMTTRDPPGQPIRRVIIMQRIHERDLVGYLLERAEQDNGRPWEQLVLPMEFESKRKATTSIGFEDPRTEEGELLWPAAFSKSRTEELQKDLGSVNYSAQCQQQPVPRGGTLFKRAWFPIVPEIPHDLETCRGWDFAATELLESRDPDFTAGVKIGHSRITGAYYVIHAVKERISAMKVEMLVTSTAMADGIECRIRLEQEPGAAGKMLSQRFIQILDGFIAKAERSSGSKVARAAPFAAQAEAGNVRLLSGPWNEMWLDEIEAFPVARHDDLVDASVNAYEGLITRPKSFMFNRELLM